VADVKIGAQCDSLARQMGWSVRNLEAPKRSSVRDFADRYYAHRQKGLVLWFEIKGPGDRLTRGQAAFLIDQNAGQVPAGCGDFDVFLSLMRAAGMGRAALLRRAWETADIAIKLCEGKFRGETVSEALERGAP
jgi:hypothetical protein